MTKIPAELRAIAQWVGWKLSKGPDGSRPTKKPVNLRTRAICSPTDPENFSPFPEDAQLGQDRGVGFCLTESDPYLFLDFDSCLSPAGVAPWAAGILSALPATYAETSPSGNGLRLVYRLSYPYPLPKHRYVKVIGEGDGTSSHDPQVEFCFSRKYYTLTGNIREGEPETISELPVQSLLALANILGHESEPKGKGKGVKVTEEEKEEARRLMKEEGLLWEAEEVESMLLALPVEMSVAREPWLRIGMALRAWADTDVEAGLRLFHLFSSRAGEKYDREGCDATFRTLDPAGPVTMGSLVHLAREAGWTPRNRGAALVREVNENEKKPILDRMDIAVNAFYYDGKSYWSQNTVGEWVDCPKDDAKEKLRVVYALPSGRGKGGNFSAEELAIVRIREERKVDSVGPCVHQAEGLIVDPELGLRILNRSRIQTLSPADICRGPEDFPFLHATLQSYYDDTGLPDGTPPGLQRDTFLAWLQYAYRTARERKLEKGQVLIHAGPVNSGKTLLASTVIGPALGGYVDATSYLSGKTNFGASLFSSALWIVDDPEPETAEQRRSFTAKLKRMAANSVHSAEEKYQKGQTFRWNGRMIVLCNDDPQSIQAMPNLDMANRDKTLLLRVAGGKRWPSWEELRQITRRELPYLLRWLLQWTPPAHVLGNSRYVVRSWANPKLLEAAQSVDDRAFVRELIHEYVGRIRAERNPMEASYKGLRVAAGGTVYWVGKASELESELRRLDIGNPRDRSANLLGRALAQMVNRNHPGIAQSARGGMSVYRIAINEFKEEG